MPIIRRTRLCIARLKRDGTCTETRFGLSAKRTSPFKSSGVSVQSTAGSRGVRISGQQLYRPYSDIQWKTADYPLHSHLSPSLPLPCVTVCHQIPNVLYYCIWCSALVVLAVVVWSWNASCVHCVKVTVRLGRTVTFTQCTQLHPIVHPVSECHYTCVRVLDYNICHYNDV